MKPVASSESKPCMTILLMSLISKDEWVQKLWKYVSASTDKTYYLWSPVTKVVVICDIYGYGREMGDWI